MNVSLWPNMKSKQEESIATELSKLGYARLVHRFTNLSYLSIWMHYIRSDSISRVSLSDGSVLEKIQLNILANLLILLQSRWKIVSQESNLLYVRNEGGITIACRTDKGADTGNIVWIFVKQVYGQDFKGKNVVDIGMSNGDSSIYFAFQGAKRVIGFEPFEESYDLAISNIQKSGLGHAIEPFKMAVTTRSGTTNLFVYENRPTDNSVDFENMVHSKRDMTSKTVPGISLSEVIDMFKGENIDFLKMDCEGCEYGVLRSLEQSKFDKIYRIALEYHNGPQELPDLLNSKGFKINIFGNPKNIGYIIAYKMNSPSLPPL